MKKVCLFVFCLLALAGIVYAADLTWRVPQLTVSQSTLGENEKIGKRNAELNEIKAAINTLNTAFVNYSSIHKQ